ncbi:MAG: alpha/beta fold hydrolase [Ilumatobacteraceae bacterium]
MVGGTSTVVDHEGGGFSWREAGVDRASLPILLLHGLTGSRLSWEPQLVALCADRRVAAWDLPGYGQSTPADPSLGFRGLADAVVRWCDELGAPRVHLAGLSFGGMIAQYTAVYHPDRVASLALLATSPKFGLDGTKPDEWRAARLAPLDEGQQPIDFAPRVMRAIAGPHIMPDALQGQIAAAARVPADGLRASIEVLITHDSRPLLPSITAPTIVVVGELDGETPVAYAQALADGIPGAALHVVAGAGHLLNVEAPDAVTDLLRRHADDHEGRR